MKRFTAVIAASILLVTLLAGCRDSQPGADTGADSSERIRIVATIFPQYDWTRQIIGDNMDNFELILLQDTLVDLHSFQPSISDIVTISDSDLFIYVGGHSDDWVENVMRQATNPDMIVINMMDALGSAIRYEEFVEGMEHGHDCAHDHDHHHDHDCDDDDCDDDHHHDHNHDHDCDDYDCEDDHNHASRLVHVSGHVYISRLVSAYSDDDYECCCDYDYYYLCCCDYDYYPCEYDWVYEYEPCCCDYGYYYECCCDYYYAHYYNHDHDHSLDSHYHDHDHDHDCDHDYDCDHDHDHDCDDHEHGHHHHHHHGHHHHHDIYDEHVWLSLRNAIIISHAIADALSELDPDNADDFRQNLAAYTAQLSALDVDFQRMVNAAPNNTLLFADRFPFLYLVADYGINYYAAFPGCSAEAEASFSTIVFLTQRVNELGLHTIMVTESADKSIARTIINNSENRNQQILVLDSLQSVTAGNVRDGITYLDVMRSNLYVLQEALS